MRARDVATGLVGVAMLVAAALSTRPGASAMSSVLEAHARGMTGMLRASQGGTSSPLAVDLRTAAERYAQAALDELVTFWEGF